MTNVTYSIPLKRSTRRLAVNGIACPHSEDCEDQAPEPTGAVDYEIEARVKDLEDRIARMQLVLQEIHDSLQH